MTTLHIQMIVLIVAATFTPLPKIDIDRDSAGVHVTFTGGLQSTDTVAGPWTDVADATSPFNVPTNRTSRFFRAAERRNQMRIKIGSSNFIATLEDNATATAFKAMLPMTIDMSELNGNEKYFRLSMKLPTNASNLGTIQNGDLMIYGANTVVLFYKTFPTSYSYTRLGRIKDTAGLAAALGSGSVKVTYELE